MHGGFSKSEVTAIMQCMVSPVSYINGFAAAEYIFTKRNSTHQSHPDPSSKQPPEHST
jgi:hypothetical protein